MKRNLIIAGFLFLLLLLPDGVSLAPFPADRLTVLIVEETDPRSPAVAAAINSADWQELVQSRGGQWRALDDDLDPDSLKEPWKSAMKLAQEKSVPWVFVSNGVSGFDSALPTGDGELARKLKGFW